MIKRILILLLLPLNLWAGGNIYVATTGNDSTGTGAIGSPLATIAHALEHITDANGGWNIILRGGTYSEHDILITVGKTGTTGAWNTIRSYPGEWAIIDGQRSCTSNVGAVLRNGGFQAGTDRAADMAQYWIIERLEIKNGGNTSGGGCASGIWWAFGPAKIRYCSIHDNLSTSQDENPSGINGQMMQGVTIEYNYVYNNGTTGSGAGNDRQISTQTMEECCYSSNDNATNNAANAVKNLEIRYNRVNANGGTVGIGMKASNRLVPAVSGARDVTDTTYNQVGTKIHHNIVTGAVYSGIIWQSDFEQIYNNIVEMSGSGLDTWGAIMTSRRAALNGIDTIYPCVWNNTIKGGGAGLYSDADAYFFSTLQGFYVNNILDAPAETSDTWPLTILHDGSMGWYHSYTWPDSFNLTGMKIDRNYIYRGSQTSGHDIIFGKREYSGGYSSAGYSVTSFESYRSVDMFIQATQESGSNKLFVNASASTADKYRTVSTHNLGETGKTIGANGLGGNHPYLSGVTIPSYIGATNPDDNAWVAGVLALDATYMASATDGSDPSWIEGSTPTPAPPTLSNVTISNGRVQ